MTADVQPGAAARTTRTAPTVRCPLRPAEPCTLCHPDAKLGPQDCPTVALVMSDQMGR